MTEHIARQAAAFAILCLALPRDAVAQDFKFEPIGPKTREILKAPVKVEAFRIARPAAGQAAKEPAIGIGGLKFEIKKSVKLKDTKLVADLKKLVLDPKSRNSSGASGFSPIFAIRVTGKKNRTVTVLFAQGFQFAIYAEVKRGKPIEGNSGGFLDDKLLPIAKRLEKRAFAKPVKEKGRE